MSEERQKLYYTIGEVADELGVNRSLVRYWDERFPQVKPRKNRRGERFFTEKDIKVLKRIQHLTKEKGYTLKGAKKQLQGSPEEVESKAEALDRLKKLREELKEWKKALREQGKQNSRSSGQ